jgi:hypothetical protein
MDGGDELDEMIARDAKGALGEEGGVSRVERTSAGVVEGARTAVRLGE